ncbi:MAG TPA: hypothetical protein VGL83_19070 [Stellaceae bacterium]|jgi:hypothetical protein
MKSNSILRAGILTIVLAAAAAIQGCSVVPQQYAAGNTVLPSGVAATAQDTGPYSGQAWQYELDNAMTSDNGGE